MEQVGKLVIVMWSADPERPALAAAPLVYAQAARALDVDVEVHFTSGAVRWAFDGVAERAYTDRARTRTVADYIRECRAAGVRFFCCSMALAEHRKGEALIPELATVAGATAVVMEMLRLDARVVVF